MHRPDNPQTDLTGQPANDRPRRPSQRLIGRPPAQVIIVFIHLRLNLSRSPSFLRHPYTYKMPQDCSFLGRGGPRTPETRRANQLLYRTLNFFRRRHFFLNCAWSSGVIVSMVRAGGPARPSRFPAPFRHSRPVFAAVFRGSRRPSPGPGLVMSCPARSRRDPGRFFRGAVLNANLSPPEVGSDRLAAGVDCASRLLETGDLPGRYSRAM